MLSAFGVEDTRLSKALTHDQKRDAGVAGGVAGTAYGYQAGGALHARHNARVLADPKRAAGVARETARHGGESFVGGGGPEAMKAQSEAYKAAAKANPDVKRVRPTADRWSSHFHQVKRIRRAYDADKPVPGVGRAVLRPVKAKAEADANIMRNLNHGSPKGPTLHRSMRTDKTYKVGDTVDFHDLSSWTSDEHVANAYRRVGDPTKQGPAHSFRRESGHGTSFESASPRFQQKEWIAGGQHKVTHIDDRGTIHVQPTGQKGNWKQPPQKSAGQSAMKAAKNVSRLIRKTDRVRVLRPL